MEIFTLNQIIYKPQSFRELLTKMANHVKRHGSATIIREKGINLWFVEDRMYTLSWGEEMMLKRLFTTDEWEKIKIY